MFASDSNKFGVSRYCGMNWGAGLAPSDIRVGFDPTPPNPTPSSKVQFRMMPTYTTLSPRSYPRPRYYNSRNRVLSRVARSASCVRAVATSPRPMPQSSPASASCASAVATRYGIIAVTTAVLIAVGTPAAAQSGSTAQVAGTAELCATADTAQFSDVSDGDYAVEYILCAKALGLTKGDQTGGFSPRRTFSRAQTAAFFTRLWTDNLAV